VKKIFVLLALSMALAFSSIPASAQSVRHDPSAASPVAASVVMEPIAKSGEASVTDILRDLALELRNSGADSLTLSRFASRMGAIEQLDHTRHLTREERDKLAQVLICSDAGRERPLNVPARIREEAETMEANLYLLPYSSRERVRAQLERLKTVK
jgi:hypothetical protein